MPRARVLGWAGSAGFHLAVGAALLLGLRTPPSDVMPVMLLEMPAPEPEAVTPPAPEPPAPLPPEPPMPAEAPPEPEPPVAQLPPEPEPPPKIEPPPEPEPPPERSVAEVAELPLPVPLPPPPKPVAAPRHPAPARPAPVPAPPTTATAQQTTAAAAATPAPVSAAPPPSYIALLLGALERHKSYPRDARLRRAQGVAMLRFRMRRDGTVVSFRVERSAGDTALDEAVVTMIQNASPLPVPPADMAGDTIEMTIPVRFALR